MNPNIKKSEIVQNTTNTPSGQIVEGVRGNIASIGSQREFMDEVVKKIAGRIEEDESVRNADFLKELDPSLHKEMADKLMLVPEGPWIVLTFLDSFQNVNRYVLLERAIKQFHYGWLVAEYLSDYKMIDDPDRVVKMLSSEDQLTFRTRKFYKSRNS